MNEIREVESHPSVVFCCPSGLSHPTNTNTDADHAETEVTEKYWFQIARVQELSAPNGER